MPHPLGTAYIYSSTYYGRYVLQLVVDGRQHVPPELVQAARRVFQPDRKPGCETITLNQVRFVRSTPPNPHCTATLLRRIEDLGYKVYR